MIITQKYHSSQEIDPEFIEPLEELMREHAPSLEWIRLKEKLSSENIHYSYYLFFGDTKNSPVGFAQVSIKNEAGDSEPSTTLSPIKKLFRKSGLNKAPKTRTKEIVWSSPTSSKEGVVFEPAFLKGGLAKTAEIVEEYNKREEVLRQELMVGDEIFGNAKLLPAPELNRESIVNCLVKNRPNYQEYINALPPEAQREIKKIWKDAYRDQSWRVGEYEHFKECFEYKKNGSKQYKELRKDSKLAPYIRMADLFLTFESPDEVFAFVFVFHGRPGQIFFKPFSLSETLSGQSNIEKLLIQAAVMRFYEDAQSSKLRFLEPTPYTRALADWGFTRKSVHTLETKSI